VSNRASPLQMVAIMASLGMMAGGSAQEWPLPSPRDPPPPSPRRSVYAPEPREPVKREPTRAELLAAEKRARKAAKRKGRS
jgi:hypothetical protein